LAHRNKGVIAFGTVAAASVFIAAGPQPAKAQETVLPIRLKLGVLLPTDSDVRDLVGNPIFSGEVQVDLPSLGQGRSAVSLGYLERGSHGNSFRAIPLTLTRFFSPPNPLAGTTGNLYFGGGVGVYFLHRGGDGSANATKFGIHGVVGYQFPNPWFVEGKYHLVSGGVNGLSPNGLDIYVGRKF
jgi:hypothetical protein